MPPHDITRLLADLRLGDQGALDVLMPLVYDELRSLARGYLRKEGAGHTMDSVALVNEAYVKLSNQQQLTPQNRAHFFATAAGAMRRILVDHARAKKAMKRGGGIAAVPLDGTTAILSDDRAEDLVALDEALTGLAAVHAEAAQIVEYIFFSGLTYEEIAGVLNTSASTVRRRWRAAKAWLAVELQTSG